ncbi:MAG: DUF3820 family protein [Sulfurimonas sp.]|nr:DUF3820 family protein [Sulfurimonas sp.]
MIKPKFTFTKYKNSFEVNVKNLEELEVTQIKEIQEFVDNRKGVFDFETYSFVIQKKLEFYEFVSLIKNSSIDAVIDERILKVQHQAKVAFGKYKGMLYSELPDSYLLWLKGNYMGKDREIIDIEINNRKL